MLRSCLAFAKPLLCISFAYAPFISVCVCLWTGLITDPPIIWPPAVSTSSSTGLMREPGILWGESLEERWVVIQFIHVWTLLHLRSFLRSSDRFLCAPAGLSWSDGDRRSDSLHPEPRPPERPHPGRLRVPGTRLQRSDYDRHLPADAGAVESGGGASVRLLHGRRARIHLALGGWVLR